MLDYLSKLNEQQYKAATCVDGPLLILAGAGSGKTGTMTHRIAYMIKEKNINPYNILAVTFTNKAAGEMRGRVEDLCGRYPGMWISTFHSSCLRILRKEADKLGYDKNFVVYDTVDQKAVAKAIIKELELDEKIFAPAYILSVISDNKENQISASDFLIKAGSFGPNKTLASCYTMYEEKLKSNNALDFDDLILKTVELFEKFPDVLSAYQNMFKYIMVDEYQDTNMLQYKLIKLLAGSTKNICVVGDDDQCIYEWRGANIQNILSFEVDFPGAKIIKLEQNYRSTGNIINAAHSVIENNKGRKDKKLWTASDDGEKIEYYRADDDKEEARYIAAKINKLKREDPTLSFKDFAILYRTNVQSRRFEECFGSLGLPYQVLSGLRFYDRKEIKDMLCYMRLILNPKDDISLIRVLNEPKRGIGDKSQQNIQTVARLNGWNLLEALGSDVVLDGLSSRARDEAINLVNTIKSLSVEQNNMSVSDLYDTLLFKTGYMKALEDMHTVEADGRVDNILEFKSVIAEKEKECSEADETLTLESFMEGLALVSDIDNHDPDADSVSLMTLHSAKGLEFKVVFMPGMEMGLFPSYRSMDKGDNLEEERRLCYVGMTRAKERLFLSSAELRMLYGKTDFTSESPFLSEIDKKYLTGHAVYDKKKKNISSDRFNPVSKYNGNDSYVSPIAAAYNAKTRASSIVQKATLAGVEVLPGDKVEHEKFGVGTVIKSEDNVLTVVFDGCGTKNLAKDLAPLKKV
ncbi:MAG: UvrD-helicase domain-containing protein [Clostridia bacterium]|nr:UvrD-helicase domain-containing protein [Clostridia bacterium]